ncbi:hypothetical protein [Flavobacterium soyangense]|uniref:Outer membrane protein beta-barrel domain-containing protein n=1 Tax=Flavobacterium soyangense TaxID=2023265 RepID=A0A930U8E1_9FLAO|nr:hypothetical protein [Flavobacterium soyangense]MBF2708621.1 hypothetical protein [Flavobacterium soyangense]
MKKNILLAAMLFGLVISAQAQDISKNALGLRLGDNDGFGTEVSYQARLSQMNRLELDLGLRSNNNENDLKLAGLYQWVWNIDGGFNWYAGIGGGVGSWKYNDNHGVTDSGAFAFAAGDLGIEYNFDFPIQVSLDVRPELYFASNSYVDNNYGSDLALAVRYRF